jgi:hypothetical protein
MVNDGLGRRAANDEDRSFYLRGNKVWRRLALKAPLVGHQPGQDAKSILPVDVVGLPHVDRLEAFTNPSHAFLRLTENELSPSMFNHDW